MSYSVKALKLYKNLTKKKPSKIPNKICFYGKPENLSYDNYCVKYEIINKWLKKQIHITDKLKFQNKIVPGILSADYFSLKWPYLFVQDLKYYLYRGKAQIHENIILIECLNFNVYVCDKPLDLIDIENKKFQETEIKLKITAMDLETVTMVSGVQICMKVNWDNTLNSLLLSEPETEYNFNSGYLTVMKKSEIRAFIKF